MITDVRISVSKELAAHYDLILQRRDDLLQDANAEDKDINTILNTTTNIIRDLAKIQQELYNSEKFAILQQIIIEELKLCDPELQEKVLQALELRAKIL